MPQPDPLFSEDTLCRAYAASQRNAIRLRETRHCGCFYCERLFLTREITAWTDTDHGVGTGTALCPNCRIDAVLPDPVPTTPDAPLPLSGPFVRAMHERFFQGMPREPVRSDAEVRRPPLPRGARYHMTPADAPLITAAIGMIEWLHTLPESHPADRAVMDRMLIVLRALPEARPDMDLDVSCSGTEIDRTPLGHRCWSITVDPLEASLAFTSMYWPEHDPTDAVTAIAHEISITWSLGAPAAGTLDYRRDHWPRELAALSDFRSRALGFAVQTSASPA